jgi:hypothetical protein
MIVSLRIFVGNKLGIRKVNLVTWVDPNQPAQPVSLFGVDCVLLLSVSLFVLFIVQYPYLCFTLFSIPICAFKCIVSVFMLFSVSVTYSCFSMFSIPIHAFLSFSIPICAFHCSVSLFMLFTVQYPYSCSSMFNIPIHAFHCFSIPIHAFAVQYPYSCFSSLLQSICFFSFSAMHLHYGDLTDSTCLVKIISQVRPHEIYNLGAQSHVKVSQDLKKYIT